MLICAEYIWLDGNTPTKNVRSKTKILSLKDDHHITLSSFPIWNFDGSSTFQSPGERSDLLLKPVRFVLDPIRGDKNCLVLCEVFDSSKEPNKTNTRHHLRKVMDSGGNDLDVYVGIEQEYTLFKHKIPLGWPEDLSLAPQGPYYCAVGAELIFGREIAEEHLALCLKAGLMIYGINAEVMPSQWEFQIGFRDNLIEKADPLLIADHMWIARWLLLRVAEKYGVKVSFDNKPLKGDWNGAGSHTNFSTKEMRDSGLGFITIKSFTDRLKREHKRHMACYGDKNYERLTGKYETCDINTFKVGSLDRGASVRIPHNVHINKCGYIEDRRPGANADPYEVLKLLVETYMMN